MIARFDLRSPNSRRAPARARKRCAMLREALLSARSDMRRADGWLICSSSMYLCVCSQRHSPCPTSPLSRKKTTIFLGGEHTPPSPVIPRIRTQAHSLDNNLLNSFSACVHIKRHRDNRALHRQKRKQLAEEAAAAMMMQQRSTAGPAARGGSRVKFSVPHARPSSMRSRGASVRVAASAGAKQRPE